MTIPQLERLNFNSVEDLKQLISFRQDIDTNTWKKPPEDLFNEIKNGDCILELNKVLT